jgi:selenocysteine lyase/cysteine desulfurase
MSPTPDTGSVTRGVETVDVARRRRETPGCELSAHLNNAGSALPPAPVLEATVGYLRREAELGGYETVDAAEEELTAARGHLARLVSAGTGNLALVENATVATAQALSAFDFEPGDSLITSRIDYPSSQIMYLSLARRRGLRVLRADDLPEGGVDPASVARLLAREPRCRLVSVSWVPTNSGLVQDVDGVAQVCERAGVPLLVDACQAVGQIPVDAPALGCDYLAATGRKFLRGPRGTGFLYVSDRALARGDHPLLPDLRGAEWSEADRYDLAPDARRFENWEFSHALVLGLGEAARYALEVGVEAGGARARRLAQEARRLLAVLPGARVLDRGWDRSDSGPGKEPPAAIVSVAFDGRDANDLVAALRERRVHTSASTRTSGVLDMDDKGVASTLRVSPHYYTTEDELDTLVEALEEIL